MKDMFWGCILLLIVWIWDHAGVYFRWMSGCLLSIILVAGLAFALPILHDILINI